MYYHISVSPSLKKKKTLHSKHLRLTISSDLGYCQSEMFKMLSADLTPQYTLRILTALLKLSLEAQCSKSTNG